MSAIDQFRAQLERLESRLTAALQSIVEFTPISVSSADGAKDAVKVQGDPSDRQRSVRRVSPWGISGRPVAGAGVLAAVVKAIAGSFGGMIVGIASDTYGPQDLEEGETAIWNKTNGTLIKLKADGTITIDAASGKDIILNAGTAKVARVGDKIASHLHAAGTLMCPNTGTSVPVAVTGSTAAHAGVAIAEGAENVKA